MAKPEIAKPGTVLTITSLANPLVKEIRGLALPKNRKASGLFMAEGLKLVADAVEAGWAVRTLMHASRVAGQPLLQQVAAATHARGGKVVAVNEAVLGKIARRDNPQTVIGVIEQKLLPLGAVKPGASDVWVALESVRDPGNLGTIVRTVDSVGAKGVILVGETVDPFSVEAVRATMGSVFHVPLVRAGAPDFLKFVRTWPGTVTGTHLSAKEDYRNAAYDGPVLLVMGSEQAGLTAELAAACGSLVKIPMAGKADSLNLAVATGIMLYEIRRKDLRIK